MIQLKINGEAFPFEGDPDTPLLWVLRDAAGLKGTKFGCGKGLCGACSVHLDGNLVRSCVLPVSAIANMSITTIEGLSADASHPVQQAWLDEAVPQCGYCQSGMIMAAVDLLNKNSQPTDEDINQSITNICRCGTYPRIRKAIHSASSLKK
jgi:isoquinoline 1-oxidoreductase alpha subunit